MIRPVPLASLRRLITAAAALLVTLLAFPAAAVSVARPNILLIISDDQAWTDYGFMGHPHVRTPRLDRLAAESLTFPRGYVPASLCCPSLASIVTGLYPHQHRVVCNDPPRPKGVPAAQFYASNAYQEGREQLARFIEAVPTLPRILASNGYLALQTGKWWQGHFRRGGFTHGMTLGSRHGDAGLEIGRQTLQPIYDFLELARRESKPWLVWYAPMMPHDPHTPPDRLLQRYLPLAPSPAVAKYWAMVEWFDETCGQLLDHLDARGLSSNTLVAYVTDNGWITDPATGRFAPRSKQSPYDGGLRTPILLRCPGRIAPRKDEHAVSSLDLLPTLLRFADVPLPRDLPGLDLLNARAVARRSQVQGACFTHDAVDLNQPDSGLRWRWIVQDGWKAILPASWNEPQARPELYRITADPLEATNLASAEPARLRRLTRSLDRWWRPAVAK